MDGLDYIVNNFLDIMWGEQMNTYGKIKVGSILYLQGEYEKYQPLKVRVIGFVYDRTDKTYIYNLMTEERSFLLRTEDYILKYRRK